MWTVFKTIYQHNITLNIIIVVGLGTSGLIIKLDLV